MKKELIFILIVVSVFFISGCDDTIGRKLNMVNEGGGGGSPLIMKGEDPYPEVTLSEPEIDGLNVIQNGGASPICGNIDETWCKNINPDAEGDGPFEFKWGDGQILCSWFAGEHTYENSGDYEIKVRVKNTCGFISERPSQVSIYEIEFPLADTSDFDLFEVTVKVLDKDDNPVENANVRLYNKDHNIIYPINTYEDELHGELCDRPFRDDSHFLITNTQGEVTISIIKGNYFITTASKLDQGNQKILLLEKNLFLGEHQIIQLEAEKETSIGVQSPDGNPLNDAVFWVTFADKKPGYSPFFFGDVNLPIDLQSSSGSILSFFFFRRPINQDGYVFVEDINTDNPTHLVSRQYGDLAKLDYQAFNGNNELDTIGAGYIGFYDYYIDNFGIDFEIIPTATLFVDPQIMRIWFRLTKDEQSFTLFKGGGEVIEPQAGEELSFSIGGPFSLDLAIASYDLPYHAWHNYMWFLVKDAYGNVIADYETINLEVPHIIIKQEDAVVFDKPLENNYPTIHMDVRDNYYFEDFSDYTITFNENFHEFGSIDLIDAPMENYEMEILSFESENFEYLMPGELDFLENDWKTNFEFFYEEMVSLMGISTTHKIPFRVVIDGAERAWAPIVWPLTAYNCDTRNYNCWGLITHEIGHPFTINEPLLAIDGNPYNEESKASYLGIIASRGVDTIVGDFMQTRFPNLFTFLEDENICYDEIEIIQTLMLYLDKKYLNKKPTKDLILNWDSEYKSIYDSLISKGYNHHEAYGVLYSRNVGENLGPLWEKFGLADSSRITEALNLEVSWSECNIEIIPKNCDEVCEDIGKICVGGCTTLEGVENQGAEVFVSVDDCSSETSFPSGCLNTIGSGMSRHCCCL